MADYQLTATENTVIRTVDQAYIPNDPANRDWIEYQKWLDDGGVPDPYVPPDPPPPVIDDPVQDVVLLDHENRLRTLEGVTPPLTMAEFVAKVKK